MERWKRNKLGQKVNSKERIERRMKQMTWREREDVGVFEKGIRRERKRKIRHKYMKSAK